MKRRRSRKTHAAFLTDIVASSAATFTTLAVRVPQLMTASMSAAEYQRMVLEKVAAAAEGLAAGAAAAVKIGAGRRSRSPGHLLDAGLTVAEAMSRPARKRVKANARRLGRTPKA